MRYLLTIYQPHWDPSETSPEERAESMEGYAAFTADLLRRGVMEGGDALETAETATTVRLRGSEVITTDGPFAETTEILGGYYVLKVKDLDEAIAIAAACPGAKIGSVELRPIVDLGADYQQALLERAGIA